jgi:Permuted papain-like amidase enzyme, YaeF/YiiX, C92 family
MKNDLTTYNFLAPQMNTGDLIEWRSNSAIGSAIRFFTKKDVNHSSLVVRLPYEGCSRRFVVEAIGSGLEFRLLSNQLENYHGSAWWYNLKNEPKKPLAKMGEWALTEVSKGIKYDFADLIKQAFGRVSLDAQRWFCSEVVDACYIEHGIIQPDPDGARRPGEFSNLGIFESKARLI